MIKLEKNYIGNFFDKKVTKTIIYCMSSSTPTKVILHFFVFWGGQSGSDPIRIRIGSNPDRIQSGSEKLVVEKQKVVQYPPGLI